MFQGFFVWRLHELFILVRLCCGCSGIQGSLPIWLTVRPCLTQSPWCADGSRPTAWLTKRPRAVRWLCAWCWMERAPGTIRLEGRFQNGTHQYWCQHSRMRSQKWILPVPGKLTLGGSLTQVSWPDPSTFQTTISVLGLRARDLLKASLRVESWFLTALWLTNVKFPWFPKPDVWGINLLGTEHSGWQVQCGDQSPLSWGRISVGNVSHLCWASGPD